VRTKQRSNGQVLRWTPERHHECSRELLPRGGSNNTRTKHLMGQLPSSLQTAVDPVPIDG